MTFGKTSSEAEMLKIELQQAEEKIHKASVLLEKLAGESGRWNTSLEEITTGLKNIPYQSMKASAFINYLAAKDEGVRVTKLALWDSRFGGVSTAESTGFSLVKYLSDESQILEYISAGLPSDQLSIENALISLTSDKSPLVIDPSYSLSQWLIAKCKQDKQVELVSSQEKKMVSVLELGIRFGKTVIVTEVDGVDSLFVNLLRKDLHKQGARLVVNVGDKIVDWNENFRLIFMSRNQSIKLEPNLAALVNTVNNLVTKKGLEEKLLSVIINDQKPGLESKKKDCLEQERGLKIEIGKLEKQLLEELASSSGNILENTALLNSLEETKSKSLAIAESLRESSRLKESLERERGAYRYLAERGTLVFLLLKDFNIVNHMYSFSLQEFMKVFQSNLKNSSAQTPKEFVQELTTLLLKGVLLRFGCGLQKKDKLAFALHLLSKQEGVFQENELEFLLDRVEGSEPKVSLPSWAAEECNQPFMKLSGVFPALVRGLKFEQPEWRSWAAEAECEKKFPSSMMLRPIQKVLLVKVFREDRLQDALEDFCCSALGISNLNEGVSNMASIYAAEPASDTPILFITSVGSDPSKEIEDFAVATVGKEKFFQISMGGGQNEAAMKSLESCASKGEWLCLKNLHLVPNFLPELEKTLNSLELNSGFKLFLTTEEHPKFPTVLLSCCYKFSYEAPPGIRMNAERVFTTIGSSMLKQMTNEEARITNILAIFHALLQERRTYIPQGWSKYYEFSLSDFKSGSQVLETVMMDRKQVDWPGLYGLFENAIYGGRIDRLVDLDVLRAYLETMFNEETLKTGKLGIGVTVPNSLDMKDHVKVLNQLPDINKPSYFGLPNVFQLSIKRNAVFNTSNLLKVLAKGKNADSSDDSNSAASKLKILSGLVSPLIILWKSNTFVTQNTTQS